MTIQEYITAYEPWLHDLFLDPDQCYHELRDKADALALKVGLPVSLEGRYSEGLWDVVMSR